MSLKIPKVLAFERKLCNSDGLMYEGSWENRNDPSKWDPIKLQHKAVRGTISNHMENKISTDQLKLQAKIENPNIQSVDHAALSFSADTLKLVFTLRVLGNLLTASTCNNQDYQIALNKKIGDYLQEQKCHQIALHYAENLANGRFLWRNRIYAEELEIKITLFELGKEVKNWVFDGQQFSLRKFKGSEESQIRELAEEIKKGLMGESFIFFKIEAFGRIGFGQEVFPSQELVRDKGKDKYRKSKFLYSVNDVAAMHSQKIGNAIRTIDIWYEGADEIGPIPVEPYGSVTNRAKAYREPSSKKVDFYSLLDKWIGKDKVPTIEEQHFVVACLVRGGVFSANKD